MLPSLALLWTSSLLKKKEEDARPVKKSRIYSPSIEDSSESEEEDQFGDNSPADTAHV